MKSLAEFPTEVLALIFAGDASFLVITMLKCGNGLMSFKLTRCIESITLEDQRHLANPRWPKCLATFTRLRNLSVSVKGALMPASMLLLAEILQLPPTLETLNIASLDTVWSAPSSSDVANRPLHRVNYASYLSLLSYLDRETPFPLLNKVRIGSTPISPLSFHLLSNVKVIVSNLWINSLRPPLPLIESFEGWAIHHETSPMTLPPSLKHVSHMRTRVQVLSSDVTCDIFHAVERWSAELARLLPVHPTSLILEGIDIDSLEQVHPIWTESFPRTLRKLRFCRDTRLNDLLVSKLPRTLTSISGHIYYYRADSLNGVVLDLPNLRKWKSQALVHPYMVKKLPPSVTKFQMYFNSELGTSKLDSVLPESLTSFDYESWYLSVPPSLFYLKHLKSFSGTIEPKDMRHLPSSLTRIDFNRTDWNSNDPSLLFTSALHLPSLVTLTMKCWIIDHLNYLPRTITNLTISNLQGEISAASQFALLPPLLESLVLHRVTGKRPEMDCFAHLTRLRYIRVGGKDPRLSHLDVVPLSHASYFKGDAVPINALNNPFWSHLDNQAHSLHLNLKSILPSNWIPLIVEAANAIDCCMIEVDDTTRHSMMQLATQPRLTEWTQSRLLELCLMPYWTVRKLGIAICILDHENYVQPTK